MGKFNDNEQINKFQKIHKAAICAIVMDEEPYLKEWVDYHIGLGFDYISIFDNSEHHDFQNWRTDLQGIKINVTHFPGEGKQTEAYRTCALRLSKRNLTKWVAFFDVDEFLVLRRHKNVGLFLEEHLSSGGLALNRVTMGSSNLTIYEPYPVSLRFQYRMENATDNHVKSVAVLDDINFDGAFHAHYPPLKTGKQNKDTNGRNVSVYFNIKGPEDIAAFYHFYSKSRMEYYKKWLRGRVADLNSKNDYNGAKNALLQGFPPGAIFDNIVWRTLTTNVPKYTFYEMLKENITN